jgi:hypothetical protein
MKRGRPFEPGNLAGCGRPKGSRNKRSLFAKELLEEHSEAIVRKALVMALQGDGPILRTLLNMLLPRPKDLPCKIGPLPMGTTEDLSQTFDATLDGVVTGQITPSMAREIFGWIEGRRRVLETEQLARRVSVLEQSHQGNRR